MPDQVALPKDYSWIWKFIGPGMAIAAALVVLWGTVERHDERINRNTQDIEAARALNQSVQELRVSVEVQNALLSSITDRIDGCCSNRDR